VKTILPAEMNRLIINQNQKADSSEQADGGCKRKSALLAIADLSGNTTSNKRPNTELISARVTSSRPSKWNSESKNSKRMLTSPEQLCTAFDAPPFSSMHVEDIRVNRRRGLVAVQLSEGSEEDIVNFSN
jgi:hypothetical protein